MAELAEQQGAVISSVILGALAGAAGLPFALESYRQAIRAGGIAVETNLAAFDASVARAQAGRSSSPAGRREVAQDARVSRAFRLPCRVACNGFPKPPARRSRMASSG